MLRPRRRRRDLPTLTWRALAAALLAAVALASPASGVAQPPTPKGGATWAAEWPVVGEGARAGEVAAISALRGSIESGGLQVEKGFTAGTLESRAHDMGGEFMALGATWQADLPLGGALVLEVSLSRDGKAWGEWQPLEAEEDLGPEDELPTQGHSELLFAPGRHVRVRVSLSAGQEQTPVSLNALKLVAIDASAGPSTDALSAYASPAGTAASSAPTVITRAQWGANEAYMKWDPEYVTVKAFVVHHTTGSNISVDADPAAFIRSIYYYHAVSLGWGDIGYNFLVDRQGRIYEGRYGGDSVVGAHATVYNKGSVGVALLGTYTTDPVPSAAVAGLESLLVWKCGVHGIDPLGSTFLFDRVLPNVMGHRDCNSTTCPGDRVYALLPQIRTDVAPLVPPPLSLSVKEPAANQSIAAVTYVRWEANAAIGDVTVSVDGQVRKTVPASETSWAWNTTPDADGLHTLRVTATDSWGRSTNSEVQVQVDNTPPTGSVSAPAVTNSAGVTLNLGCQGCTSVQFGRGWRWEGEALGHQGGQLVTDPAAANGSAWFGQAGVDGWGAWHGAYYCGLPFPGDYEAVFWLRSGRNDVATEVAELDVSDQAGTRYLAPAQPVLASDFSALGRYQPFSELFRYPDQGTSCRSGATSDGLELRTWYQGTADVWLDRVEIYTAAQPFAASAWVPLPAAEGTYTVEVRFKDAAGNVSPVYTKAVTVDLSPTVWGQPGSTGIPVSDASHLAKTAAYAVSADGVHWGNWVSQDLTLAGDEKTGTLPAQPAWPDYCVRVRVEDTAGHVSYSPPIRWPADSDPTPTYEWWTSCGVRIHLPLVAH